MSEDEALHEDDSVHKRTNATEKGRQENMKAAKERLLACAFLTATCEKKHNNLWKTHGMITSWQKTHFLQQ